MEAVLAVVPTATFKENWKYDRGRVDKLPGITMGWQGARRVDELGIRTERHRHKWQHNVLVRLWFPYEPANSTNHDTDVLDGIQSFVDAVEDDPTLGGRVDGSGIARIDQPSLLQNAAGNIVGMGVDVLVYVVSTGAWT